MQTSTLKDQSRLIDPVGAVRVHLDAKYVRLQVNLCHIDHHSRSDFVAVESCLVVFESVITHISLEIRGP